MYKVIDLFAGAGGLSLGFMQTGKYEIAAAFEINKNAQETYKKNHADTKMYSDVCVADFHIIEEEVGDIDIVIGGPPCQGFSNANRQKNHAVNMNNMLVKQYVRSVLEIQPKAFVMENVGMLKSDVHRFYLRNDETETIAEHEIDTLISEINLLDEKYYSEEIAKDITDRNTVNEKVWNEYICFNNAAEALNSFYDEELETSLIIDKIEKAIMFQRCFSKVKELYDNNLKIEEFDCVKGIKAKIQSYSVLDYLTKMLGKEYSFTNGVLNAADFGAPQKRIRFVFIGVKKNIASELKMPVGDFAEENYRTVGDAIKDLEEVMTIYETNEDFGTKLNEDFKPTALTSYLRDSNTLYNHIITRTREVAMKRFESIAPGGNFHSLDSSLKENTYTDINRTQNTIYQRLRYDKPSGTVVNVRKSMWIHPVLNRAVSIREAARLQTFPDSFIFCGSKDSQYQQVGNAVPPILAKAVAERLAEYLDGESDG